MSINLALRVERLRPMIFLRESLMKLGINSNLDTEPIPFTIMLYKCAYARSERLHLVSEMRYEFVEIF